MQIVILDTDNVISTLLRSMLSEVSSNVTSAYTAHEALILSKDSPSLIIINDLAEFQKPATDIMREIQIESPDSEFLIVTPTNINSDHEADLITAGFSDILKMPLSKKLVCARVCRILRGMVNTRELEEIAAEDPLTGLSNRREFDKILPEEIRRSIRNNEPLSFVMIDVDHFKLYNDTYGHLAGDKVLAIVAQAVKSALRRPGDVAFRYGGEEFSLILPNTDKSGAWCICSRIEKDIKNLAISHTSSKVSNVITLSIGITTKTYGVDVAYSNSFVSDIISEADNTLYRAKLDGRNRIIHKDEVTSKKIANNREKNHGSSI